MDSRTKHNMFNLLFYLKLQFISMLFLILVCAPANSQWCQLTNNDVNYMSLSEILTTVYTKPTFWWVHYMRE